MATKQKLSFELWMKQVDRNVILLAGCSVYDLPDCCYANWHVGGKSPLMAARKAIKQAQSEE